MGFDNWYDLDMSISPDSLRDRDPDKFEEELAKISEGRVPATTDTESTKIKKLTEEEEEALDSSTEVKKIKETDKYEIVEPQTRSAMKSYAEGADWSAVTKWNRYQKLGWRALVLTDKETGDKYNIVVPSSGQPKAYGPQGYSVGFIYLEKKFGLTKEDLGAPLERASAAPGTEVKKIKETDKYEIVEPQTHSAMRSCGKGTRWSVSIKTPVYWEAFLEGGRRIFVLEDKKTKEKYGIVISPKGEAIAYDAWDRPVDFNILTKEYGLTKEDIEFLQLQILNLQRLRS